MANPHNIKVGQILYDYPLKKYEVEKIGNKYFTIKGDYQKKKFSLDDLTYKNPNYSQRNEQLYLSKESIYNDIKKTRLARNIETFVDKGFVFRLSLEQLELITKILELE